MNNILLVFLGGGTGAVARYAMAVVIGKHTTSSFPYHTLSINLLGAFLIGVIMELMALRASGADPMRLLLVTGFLGGFTTFSAFSLESTLMLQKGDYASLLTYIGASVMGTIIAVMIGSGIVKSIS